MRIVSQVMDLQRNSLATLVPVEVNYLTFLHDDDQGLHEVRVASQDSSVYFGCLSHAARQSQNQIPKAPRNRSLIARTSYGFC